MNGENRPLCKFYFLLLFLFINFKGTNWKSIARKEPSTTTFEELVQNQGEIEK